MDLYWDSADFPDIHRLFKIPYDKLMNIIYVFSKEMNISYKDLNDMPFFEILNIIEVYQENVKEQNKQHEMENKRMESQMSDIKNQYNYNDMMRQQQQMSNNLGQMPNFNMPNFNMP